jgi:hypothetical protein
MAKFTTYANIITPESLSVKLYDTGIRKTRPGLRLEDVLRGTGGVYEKKLALSRDLRERIKRVAVLTSDQELLRIADLREVTVSLEHLRSADPTTTLIEIGCRLDVTDEESKRLGIRHEGPYDSATSALIDNGNTD